MSGLLRTTCVAALASIPLLTGLAIQTVTTLEVEEERPDSGDLTTKLEAMSRISILRFEAVDELLAGRRSLPQTAAKFRHLSTLCPFDPLPFLRKIYRDRSDDELHYLHVLRHVEAVRAQGQTTDLAVEGVREEIEFRRGTGSFPFAEKGRAP